MTLTLVLDIFGILLLGWIFIKIWKASTSLSSFRAIIPAIVVSIIGRVCDTMLEHQSPRMYAFVGMSGDTFGTLFGIIGNLCDVLGIVLLGLGFFKLIQRAQAGRARISHLEKMLPICSNCKKFRTQENQWLPIEKYLDELGAPPLTHGICPECSMKLYGIAIGNPRT